MSTCTAARNSAPSVRKRTARQKSVATRKSALWTAIRAITTPAALRMATAATSR